MLKLLTYLRKLDHDKVLQFGQIFRVGHVFDFKFIVYLGNELGFLNILFPSQRIMPVLTVKSQLVWKPEVHRFF